SVLVALTLRHPIGRRRRLARREPRLEPSFPAVIRPLNDLPKPSARLRRKNSVRIGRRSLQVVHLPPCEKRPGYVPVLAFPIRGQDKRALPRPDQNSYSAHCSFLDFIIVLVLVIDFREILNRG